LLTYARGLESTGSSETKPDQVNVVNKRAANDGELSPELDLAGAGGEVVYSFSSAAGE
jgi:hypothetical protein